MRKLLQVLAAQLFAAAFVLTALSGGAHADTTPTDAELAAEWQTAWDTYKFYDASPPPLPGSGRTRQSQTISITINAPAQQVFTAYSNINNHIGRAAFLTRVSTHRDWRQSGVRYIDFTAIEDIPYQGTIVSSHTHAQQRLHEAELFYETDTWSLPNVVTHQRISFTVQKDGGTKVTERLTFDADDALIDFVVANGVASHQQTQTAIKQAIESGQL
ncbi:SRPBCC family protein [Sphaerisporangium sp. NPDC005288]|uniref:SRPBCC family protein n=1 Tax=unclassified Sphaerisporangium TaxID=2630420 RepID=UPI0033B87FE7